MTSAEDEVLAANRAFYAAFEALDADAMAAVWSTSAEVSCLHPGAAPLFGRAAVLSSWRGIFRGAGAVRVTPLDARVMMAGDVAWVVLVERLESRDRETRMRGLARATNVFVHEPAGWRMVHHHASPVLGAEPDDDADDAPKERILN